MLSQRYIFSGLNLDAEPHSLQPGDYRYATNWRTYNAVRGALGEGQAVYGHQALPLPAGLTLPAPPSALAEVVGGCLDRPGNRVVYFLYHPTPAQAGIYAYDLGTGTSAALLTGPALGLSRQRVRAARVVGDTLYWTDFAHEPRKLNLAHVVAEPALYARLLANEPRFLDLLRRGPQRPLAAVLTLDAARQERQLLPHRALQFTYRYVYVHGETSVFAPYSALLPFKPVRPYYNAVELRVPAAELPSELVKTVELAVREGDTGLWRIVARLDRAQVLGQQPYTYYGDVAGDAVDPAAAAKLFDYVPTRSRALGFVNNRLFLGGNEEGDDRSDVGLALTPVTDYLGQDTSATVYRAQSRVGLRYVPGNDQPPVYQLIGYFCLESGTHMQADARYRLVNVRNIGLTGAETSFMESEAVAGMYDYRQPLYSYADIDALALADFNALNDLLAQLNQGNITKLLTTGRTLEMQVQPPSFTLRRGVGPEGYRRVFKSGSVRRVGVQFYDANGRTAGVARGVQTFRVGGRLEHTLPLGDGDPNTPDPVGQWPSGVPASAADPLTVGLRWQLDNTRAAAEIPAGAATYSLVWTPDLTTTTFVQGVSCDGGYGSKDGNGVASLETRQYRGDHQYTLLNVANLIRQGLGYQFTAGDRVRLWARAEEVKPDGQAGGETGRVTVAALPRVAPTAHDVEILGMVGTYLLLPLVNIGSRTTSLFNKPPLADEQDVPRLLVPFEIYTPYHPAETEPFYEVGERYDVLTDPLTSDRTYSVTTGTLAGDAYLVTRRDYLLEGRRRIYTTKNPDGTERKPATGLQGVDEGSFTADQETRPVTTTADGRGFVLNGVQRGVAVVRLVEATNPDDGSNATWDLGRGRITAELRDMKREDRYSGLRFSNVYTPGAATNGLSSFEPLNEELFPREDGAITALQAVRGNLLVLQEYNTQSVYVGRTQLQDTQGKTLLAVSDRIVGSHQPLAGGVGCQHPETVQESPQGYVYWWDAAQGVQVRYAGDGTTPVSRYGVAGYWHARRRELLSAEPRPAAWYDPLSEEYVCYPGAEAGPAMAFCEALNRWTTFYPGDYEWAVGIPGGVISASQGRLYRHDQDPAHPGRVHGRDYPVAVELPVTLSQAKVIKVWQTITLEGSAGWRAPRITADTEDQPTQESRLEAFDFVTEEGQHDAAFLRDEHTPCDNPLEEGDELRSTLLTVRLEHHTPGAVPVAPPARLRAVTIGATTSSPY